MKSAIWISYDLGVRGNYESLFTWLDEHKAKDCCGNLAFLNYEHTGSVEDSLKAAFEKALEPTKQTRIYVIYRSRTTKKVKGSFVIGGRKTAPWSGFGAGFQETDVVES